MFTHVYPCLPMFTLVYSCLPILTVVYLVFTYLFTFLALLNYAPFLMIYCLPCLPCLPGYNLAYQKDGRKSSHM